MSIIMIIRSVRWNGIVEHAITQLTTMTTGYACSNAPEMAIAIEWIFDSFGLWFTRTHTHIPAHSRFTATNIAQDASKHVHTQRRTCVQSLEMLKMHLNVSIFVCDTSALQTIINVHTICDTDCRWSNDKSFINFAVSITSTLISLPRWLAQKKTTTRINEVQTLLLCCTLTHNTM